MQVCGSRVPDLGQFGQDAEDLLSAAPVLAQVGGDAPRGPHRLAADSRAPGGAQRVLVVALDGECGHERQAHQPHDPLRQ
ncbi:hypothetical protein [Methylobacterium mesophilicum]|uniref:hypothetical protein n=1 Tax=Methylobacterium mesophilicum TaxID=39956 RepID=UPI001FCF02D5|nr:hypothetical protein [Methylobacterium mesophilicum]